MSSRHAPEVRPSEITPKAVWLRRRELLAGAAALGLAGSLADPAMAAALAAAKSPLSTDEPPTQRSRTSPPTTTSTSSAPTRAIRRRTPAR